MRGREFKDAIFGHFAQTAAAFSSPKRVEIIDVLAQGERSVESIAAEIGATVANTSRHLRILRGAGLVTSRKQGLHVIYRISDPGVIEGCAALRRLSESRVAEVGRLAQGFFGAADGAEPVGIEELAKRYRDGEVLIVDVRPELEFRAGHIDGAVSIPLARLAERISELPRDRSVVAYCRGRYCVMAARAANQLRAAGVPAARLEAGYPDWLAAGLPVAVDQAS